MYSATQSIAVSLEVVELWITLLFADSLSVHDPGKESVPSEHQGGKTTQRAGTRALSEHALSFARSAILSNSAWTWSKSFLKSKTCSASL